MNAKFRYLQSLSTTESDLFLLSNLFSSAIVIEHETSFPFSFVVLLSDLHLAEKQFAPKQLKQKAGPASQWLAPFACRKFFATGRFAAEPGTLLVQKMDGRYEQWTKRAKSSAH
jgi:hypothetical protein